MLSVAILTMAIAGRALDGTLRQLTSLLALSQKFNKNIKQNLMMSVGASMFCVFGIFFLHFGIMATELYMA